MADKFSIKAVIEHYVGGAIPEKGSGWTVICCPVHDEQRPSASYNEDLGKIHCFGCTFHGDALDLIGLKEGVEEYSEQVKLAEEITGETIGGGAALAAPTRRLPLRITDGAAPVHSGGARPAPTVRTKRRRRI